MKFLGLDVGEKRIGVAKADSSVRIAVPEGVIAVNGSEINSIVRMVKIYNIDAIIVGMPRNLNGEKTKQSAFTASFVKNLNAALLSARPNNKLVRILYQDESLTSVEARKNLAGKKGGLKKGDVDTEAATLILQDFLENLSRRLLEKKQLPKRTSTPPIVKNYRSLPTPVSKPASVSETASVPSPASSTPEPPASKTRAVSRLKKKSQASVASPEPVPTSDADIAFRSSPQFASNPAVSAKRWNLLRSGIVLVAVLLVLVLSIKGLYSFLLSAPLSEIKCNSQTVAPASGPESESGACSPRQLTIPDGASSSEIASLLKEAGLIRSTLAFKLYLKISGTGGDLKSGNYRLLATAPVDKIVASLLSGGDAPVTFRFTALPGETISDIKARLLQYNYTQEEIDAAFAKEYNHPVLADKPKDASLEGYLFGETYEFYASDSVETIIERMLSELYVVVEKNNLRDKFARYGLTLHEGITLASVVQKEAGTLGKEDQKTVAQVFLSRLELGIPLGSDVTVKYALDQVDPERKTYTNNAEALEIDSCYNTRKNPGLPCGPISSPGALVLISTANPSDTSYLYFLTGDDGLMYYSTTESEHNQKIRDYCQELCAVQL